MTEVHQNNESKAGLVRTGGAALLVGFAIHIVANAVLKQFPPENPTLSELTAYLEAEASTWGIVHGMRYLAIGCLAVFLGGIMARIRSSAVSSGGWEQVGFVGGLLLLSNLLITNGLETIAFLDFELLSENPELFWLVFNVTRVLFTAEIVTWAIMIFGFSIAGWNSQTFPKPIVVVGLAAACMAMVSGVFVSVLMTSGGWIGIVDGIAVVASLLWFLSTGIWMVWRGDR